MGKLKIDLLSLVLEEGIPVGPSPRELSPLREKIKAMPLGGSYLFKSILQAKSFNTTIRAMGYKTCLSKTPNGFRVWKL